MPMRLLRSSDELATAAAAGDLDALGVLFEKYNERLHRYVGRHMYGGFASCDDVVGSVWVKVSQAIKNFTGLGFERWLFTIARNEVARHHRWSTRHPEDLTGDMFDLDTTDAADPAEALDRRFAADQLARAVGKLTKAQRDVVTNRFMCQLSLAETAAIMGKDVNAIKQLQLRALVTLRKVLGDTAQDLVSFVTTHRPATMNVTTAVETSGTLDLSMPAQGGAPV